MFCGLGKEERTKIRKKKEKIGKKKEKRRKTKRNKPHCGPKWVGWDERVSKDIQPHEIFFSVLKPFLTVTAFYAKLAGRFRVLKQKSRDLLPRNLVQTYNSLILNYCQNFM